MFKPKAAKKDYDESMLPKTRKEVFFDVLKNNWGKFILYGIFVLLISFPIHFTAVAEVFYRNYIYAQINSGALTELAGANAMISASNTLALIDIPLIALFAVCFSGVCHIMRQFVWEENVYIRYEYVKGIKQNAVQFLILGLLVGLVRFACIWFGNIITVSAGEAAYYVSYLPTAWFLIILAPPAAYMTVCIPIYAVKFHQNVKYAFMLYFKNLFKTLLAVIVCALAFIPQLFPIPLCQIIGRAVSSLLVPIILLGWYCFAFDRLDTTINKRFYPELVGRGTYKPDINNAEKTGQTEQNQNGESK